MNQKNIMTILSATLAGALGAIIVCAFFFFYYKPAHSAETPLTAEKETAPPTPEKTVVPIPPEAEIKESDVLSLNIDTTYKGYFEEDSKCRKTYNEMFKGMENDANSNSACSTNVTFNRDGSAEKKTVVRNYDNAVKNWREVESWVWKARISGAQFEQLTRSIVRNEVFKNWNNMISINTRNCTITVEHTGGIKAPMSNLTEKTTGYLPMVEAFKALDAAVVWEKVK